MAAGPQGLVPGRKVWYFEPKPNKGWGTLGDCRSAEVVEVHNAADGIVDLVFFRTGDRLGELGTKRMATYDPESNAQGGIAGTWCFPARS